MHGGGSLCLDAVRAYSPLVEEARSEGFFSTMV
jgi:hypothetical protein